MSIIRSAATVAAAFFFPTSLAAPGCIPRPYATFELTADAPGTAVDGLKIFGLPAISHFLEMFPSNPANISQGSSIFYKNDTTHLYVVAQDYAAANPNVAAPELLTSPLAGDATFESDPSTDAFTHYEEYFTATVDLWPPSSHIEFKPGKLVNPTESSPQGSTPGGWFACYQEILDEYIVYLGTPLFYHGYNPGCNTTTGIKFKSKINLLSFDIGC